MTMPSSLLQAQQASTTTKQMPSKIWKAKFGKMKPTCLKMKLIEHAANSAAADFEPKRLLSSRLVIQRERFSN